MNLTQLEYFLGDSEGVKASLNELKDKESKLENFDFHTIKLDKYFIDNITNSVVIESMFKVITEIGKELDISVVVEEVEHQWQEELIKNYSMNKVYIQGYYYSKPIEVEDLIWFKVKGGNN